MSTYIYIVYEPENIEGGGGDTVIKGVYLTFEEARKSAQQIVDMKSFNYWLRYNNISYLEVLRIMDVPIGVEVNDEMSYMSYVEATHNNEFIKTHPDYEEYKKAVIDYMNSDTYEKYQRMFL